MTLTAPNGNPTRFAKQGRASAQRQHSRLRGSHLCVGLLGLGVAFGAASLPGCKSVPKAAEKQAASQAEANNLQAKGEAYMQANALDAALAMFGLALEENPNLVDAHVGMSEVYKAQQNYPFMARAAARAVRVDPQNYDGYYNLGYARQMLGNVEQAIAAYLRALTIQPESLEANREIASAYIQEGSPAQALAYAEKAVELDDQSQGAWSNLGFVYGQMGNHDQAVEAYRKAADLGELSPPILLGLGDAYIHLGKHALAENTLEQLSSKFPSATAYERHALSVFKQQRFADALALYRRALADNSTDIPSLNGAGACLMTQYIQGGRNNRELHAQAMEMWRKSLRLKANQPRITEVLSQFQNI